MRLLMPEQPTHPGADPRLDFTLLSERYNYNANAIKESSYQ